MVKLSTSCDSARRTRHCCCPHLPTMPCGYGMWRQMLVSSLQRTVFLEMSAARNPKVHCTRSLPNTTCVKSTYYADAHGSGDVTHPRCAWLYSAVNVVSKLQARSICDGGCAAKLLKEARLPSLAPSRDGISTKGCIYLC